MLSTSIRVLNYSFHFGSLRRCSARKQSFISARSLRPASCSPTHSPLSKRRGNFNCTAATSAVGASPDANPASTLTDTGNSLEPTKYQPLTALVEDHGDRITADAEQLGGPATCRKHLNDDEVGEVVATPVPRTMEESQRQGEETSGIFGRNGLLATPHVKVLLILASIIQVSRWATLWMSFAFSFWLRKNAVFFSRKIASYYSPPGCIWLYGVLNGWCKEKDRRPRERKSG